MPTKKVRWMTNCSILSSTSSPSVLTITGLLIWNLLMSIYALISKIGIDEPKALGLDTSMVVVERVPLIINHRNRNLRRITQIVEEEKKEEKA